MRQKKERTTEILMGYGLVKIESGPKNEPDVILR